MDRPYFAILGPVQVTLDGARLRVGGPRELKALAMLLLHAGKVVSVARLIETLWEDDPPATAKSQVHNGIARLRRELAAGGADPDVIERAGPGYVIHVRDDQYDAATFAHQVAAGHLLAERAEFGAAAETLRGALRLWRGPALDGLDCPRLGGEANRLEEQRLACLERRIDLDLALGRHHDVTGELAALVAEHPTRERLVELRMLALYRCGRRLEALDVYNDTRVRLAEQNGLDPRPSLAELHRAVLASDPALEPQLPVGNQAARAPAGGHDGNPTARLPRRGASHFIGRQPDLAELPPLLRHHPVVTLTGPPGAGKTRLALEVAAAATSYPDGVVLVPLDTVTTGGDLATLVLTVLSPAHYPWRAPLENLIRTLAGSRALLVLDNCEHVAAECARLLEVLTAECPGVRVLATSRVPLGLAKERVYPVGSLSTPERDTVEAVAASEAGRLLIDRAEGVDPDFALTAHNAAHVARLCRALEGMPLALELAAGRLRAFSVGQIADRLDHQLELLATRHDGLRHRSLRAAIDWSHDLLTDAERRVFARLSVFVGGFTLEAAEAVAKDAELSEAAVMDTLGALVERSLVVAEPQPDPGDMRYRLLEALRQYAAQQLSQRGGDDLVQAGHARYFRDLAEQAEQARRGTDRGWWLHRLRDEYANLSAAMAWARDSGDHELCLRYASALSWFWKHVATRQALAWLREVLPAATDAPTAIRQRALIGAGSLALRVSLDEAKEYFQQAVLLARAHGDGRAEIAALSFMASTAVYLADAAAVRRYSDLAVNLARADGDPYVLARALMARGLTQAHCGDRGRTDDDLAEALLLFQSLKDRLGSDEVQIARAEVAHAYGDVEAARLALATITQEGMADFPSTGRAAVWLCQGWLALQEERFEEIQPALRGALGELSELHAGPYAAQRIFGPALDLSAALAFARKEYARAVSLLHAATTVLTLDGTVPQRPRVRWAGEIDARSRAVLDPAEYAQAAAHGARLGLLEALRYAELPLPSTD